MKYWRGYLTAAIFAGLSWILMQFGKSYSQLVDIIYPYVTRFLQTMLAEWTGGVDYLVWQALLITFLLVVLATLVLLVIFRWNLVQWLGWVLAAASVVFCLHTGMYGLNYYAGDLTDDICIEMVTPTQKQLEHATIYFRDQANALAKQVSRDAQGELQSPGFEELAQMAGEGFEKLTYDKLYSVFAGSTLPVKKLGWADMYTSMGIDGVTMPITGEAAVNPQTPSVALPWVMCHEMSHRMCIAREDDANFAAFLASRENSSVYFQYSAYFMAYRYCINALSSANSAAASRVRVDVSKELAQDMASYDRHYAKEMDPNASQVANTVNDSYIKVSGAEDGVASYGAVCDQLVNWYLSAVAPLMEPEEDTPKFDPFDETQVDLTGLRGYPATEPTEEAG